MMKSMDLTVGGALYLYMICLILPDSSNSLPYKESLFLWLCIEPPRHAWRRPAIQQSRDAASIGHATAALPNTHILLTIFWQVQRLQLACLQA
jgi:hypothetical protein